MNIIVVDDEPIIMQGEVMIIKRAAPDAEVRGFDRAKDALAWVENNHVDIAFLDIEMPGIKGVDLARRLKALKNDINIIFSTAYDDYYVDAMEMHASGYLRKPIKEADVKKELEDLRHPVAIPKKDLFVRCFGNFEVFCNGQPVKFRYQKTKELFAYLIDRRGAMVESEALVTVLWSDDEDHSNFFKQLRKDLKDVLAGAGAEDMIVSRRGVMGVLFDRLPCDYSYYIQGRSDGINAYHGEYMTQYDWAMPTWVNLEGKTNLWEI